MLPEQYGSWNTVYKRFARWCEHDIWTDMHQHFVNDPDMENLILDSSVIRADVQIRLTAPGDYDQILEHISVHRWFLGEARHEYIKYHEAVMSWIKQVYLPRIQAIHQHGIQQEFPDRTEADLYLWIPEHRPELVP